ncbi:MAG: O-antigen ligase family protein [Brumimicrobium sp.]|nr:O-antigen ligase family protein [Brumimicrobium sp.]
MELIRRYNWVFLLAILFLGVNSFLIYRDNYYLNALPAVLAVIYLAFFNVQSVFLLIAFCAPLSVNLEEFTDGKIGLFLPTEPILFGLLLLIITKQLISPFLPREIWKSPIIWALGFYVGWIFLTSITSTSTAVSFKFLLMKLWFIVPVIFLGVVVFKNMTNIIRFLWMYASGMVIVILYTLVRHYTYGFGEEEGHWVMSPFFKDHTIYGAAVAITLFFVLGLILYKKHDPLKQLVLFIMLSVTLVGLYFSYTRGAWLSVVAAVAVWLFIKYKVKFKYLLLTGVFALTLVILSWDQIQMELSKNTAEHTTTDFDERLQSATNITSDASNLERLNRWNAAWKMFKERPVFGFGPGTYAFEYAPYQDPEMLTIISTNFGDMGNAHSEFLGPMAEMGFFGILSVILFVAALFYRGIMLYISMPRESHDDKAMNRLLLFILLAMVTYFFHGLLNNYLDTDKAAIPVYGACAVIIALEIRYKMLKSGNH